MGTAYPELPNELVSAANGIDYAYRDNGGRDSTVPLVLLQHFRGNLDNWDPALIDALARTRRVVTFDNAGVGGSTGTTPDTIEQMARDAIAFLEDIPYAAPTAGCVVRSVDGQRRGNRPHCRHRWCGRVPRVRRCQPDRAH